MMHGPPHYGGSVRRDGRGGMRTPRSFLTLLWATATLLGLVVAGTTRIGPVLFTISGSHGVHLGDVVGFAVAYGAALVPTRHVLARRRSRPDGRYPATIGRNGTPLPAESPGGAPQPPADHGRP
jgi:hypothetical protein